MSEIKANEVIQQDFFDNTIKSTEDLIKVFQLLDKQLKTTEEFFKDVIKESNQISKNVDLTKRDDIKKVNEAYEQSKEAVEKLSKAQKKRTEIEKEQIKIQKQKEQLQKTLKGQNDQQVKTAIELTNARKEQRDRLKTLILEESKQLGTLQRLSIENKKLRQEKLTLNLETEKGIKRNQEINETLDKNNEFIKKNSDRLAQQKIGIGSYKEGIQEALPFLGRFGVHLQTLEESYKASRLALNQLTASQKAFDIALKLSVIGLIIASLGLLVKAFTSTQKGIDSLNKVLIPLRVLFESLWGVIQNVATDGFDFLARAIENPKQGLIELGEIIANNVLNRFKALGVLAESIALLFEGKFKEASTTAFNAFVQLNTGIVDADKSLKEFNNTVDEAIERGQQIALLTKLIEEGEINLIKSRSRLNLVTKEQNKIGEDTTKTVEERIIAIQKAEDAQLSLLELEQRQLDLSIKRIKLEQTSNDTSRADLKELAELEAERFNKATEITERLTTLQNKLNILKKEELKQAQDLSESLNVYNKVQEVTLENKEKEVELSEKVINQIEKETDARNKAFTDRQKKEEEDRKKREDQLKAERDFRQKIAEDTLMIADNLLSNLRDKQDKQLENELNNIQDQRQLLQQQAIQGNEDAVKSIQDLDAREADLQRKREERIKQEQKQQLVLAAIKLLTQYAGTEGGFESARQDLSKIPSIIDSLPSFDKGIEDTTPFSKGQGVDGKGGFHAILHSGETVLTAEQSAKKKGLSNDLLAEVGHKYNTGKLIEADKQRTIIVQQQQDKTEQLNALKSIEKAISNKSEVKEVWFDEVRKSLNIRTKESNKLRTTHYNTKAI